MRDCYDIIIPIYAIGGGLLNYVSLAAIYINDDYKTAEKIVFCYNSLLIVSDDKYRINYCEIKEIKKNKSDIKIVLNNETIIKIIPSDKSLLNKIYERIGEFKDNIIKIPKKYLYGVINEYYLCFTKDNNNVLIFYNLIKNIMIDKDTLYIEYFYNEELNENKSFSIKVNDEEEKAKFLDLIDYIHSFKQMKENVPYVEFINYRYREESDHEFGKKLVVEKDHIHVFEYDVYGQDYSEHDSYKIKFTEIKKFSVLSFTKDEVVFSIEVNKEQYEEKENKEVKTDFSHLYYMNPVIIWVEKLDQFFNGESIPTMLSESEEKVIKKSSPTKLKSAIQVGIFVTLIVGIIIPTIFVGKLNFRLIVISFFIPFLIIMLKKNTDNMEYKKNSDENNSLLITSNTNDSNTIDYLLSDGVGISVDNINKKVWIYNNKNNPTKVDFNRIREVDVIEELSEDIVPQNEALYDLTTMTGNEKGREYLAERKKMVKKCNSLDIQILVELSSNNMETFNINLIKERIDTSSSIYKNARDLSKKIEATINGIIKN